MPPEGWAPGVRELRVDAVPEGARGINVDGRRLHSPLQGFGRLWQKRYRVAVPAAQPAEVIATWKQHFADFWPAGNAFYAPLTGIAPGEVALIEPVLPGRMKLSTGVMVLYADAESFTLMTPQGHMFAGWITFSAEAAGDGSVVQAQILMRASDPIYELGLTMGGHRQEDRFWEHTLAQVAARFGSAAPVETEVACVDRRRQWRRWHNVWHSAAIRSVLRRRRATPPGAPGPG